MLWSGLMSLIFAWMVSLVIAWKRLQTFIGSSVLPVAKLPIK